jgi:hypothetical protein
MRRKALIVVISVLVAALIYSPSAFFAFAAPPDSRYFTSQGCDSQGPTTKDGGRRITCCWREKVPGQILGKEYCQTCTQKDGKVYDCTSKEPQAFEQPPTSSPFDPTAPLQGGVLEQPATSSPFDPTAPPQGGVSEQQEQQTPPTPAPGTTPGVLQQLEDGNFVPGFAPGFLRQQDEQPPADQGASELAPPPTTQETQPAAVEEEQSLPVCQEGLEFSEGLGFCVPTNCPEGQVLDEETGVCVPEEPEQQSQPEEQDQQQQPPSEEESSEENSN